MLTEKCLTPKQGLDFGGENTKIAQSISAIAWATTQSSAVCHDAVKILTVICTSSFYSIGSS